MNNKVKVSFILPGCIVVFQLMAACNGNTELNQDTDEKKTVIDVGDLYINKQEYKEGETFDSRNDKLFVLFSDRTNGTVSSGFTHEYTLDYDIGDYYPIKHGDPLPITAPPFPFIGPSFFWVRADYKGMKGQIGYRSVSR